MLEEKKHRIIQFEFVLVGFFKMIWTGNRFNAKVHGIAPLLWLFIAYASSFKHEVLY